VNGRYHFTLMALGNTPRDMEACVTDMVKVVQNQGIVSVREDMNMEAAFWAQMPANFEFIARAPVISSANYVGFASFHNYAVGKRDGNHWGPAISLLLSRSKTPYYFNFHVNQVGNFTVVGPTGSGKTVALSFLMSQAMRIRPEPACAFFDKDRGAEVFIRALGGQYEVLEPGEPTGFNPLQVDDTPADREFVLQLLRLLLRPRNTPELSVEQEKIIETAVEQIFLVPKAQRRFHEVRQLLTGSERQGHDDLRSRFDIWLNQRGWLFNNESDRFDASKGIIGFDLTKVLDDDDVRSAALGYIFHRIEGMLDGVRPFMMFIDEGWKILNDERFSWFLNDKLKTIRKLKGLVGFGTQSAADIVRSKMARTIIEQSVTNMFFPNPKADEESYQSQGFALTDAEMEFVRTTPPEMRQFLIRHNNDSVIATLDLSHMLDFVKVLSGTPERVMECAQLRQRYGDDPENWLHYFCGWKKEP
jgi:type IV secretion system protein VirB4